MTGHARRTTTYLADGDITIRSLEDRDFETLWRFIYGEPDPQWKKWDAPYFPLEHQDLEPFCDELRQQVLSDDVVPSRCALTVSGKLVGTVSYYWEHKPSNWLEVGIVIYDSAYWNGGIGTRALRLWIDYLFESMPSLPRIGLTTWSGNQRMMRCAEKLGMKLEGRLRKCRYYNGHYYDSIRMGILREEWQHLASLSHSSPAGRVISPIDYGGLLHHVEINVSNLECSAEFWGWFLGLLGYQPYQVWEGGRSWRLGETYLVFVQVADPYKEPSFHRRRVGLNHLAFHAASRAQVDQITHDLRARGVRILYEDRHPYAGGTNHYAVFFEDPDRIKVEVVAPEHELGVCMGPAQCTFRNDGFRHRNRVQTTPE